VRQSEIAYRAAEYISEHGLLKHFMFHPDEPGACLNGAVVAVDGGRETWPMNLSREAAHVIVKANEAFLDRFEVTSVEWNNREETTAEDVVLFLKQLGADLEARGL